MSEKIIIDIAPSGATKIAVEGVKGKSCELLTADVEKALGQVTSHKRTSEYNQKPQLKQVVKAG